MKNILLLILVAFTATTSVAEVTKSRGRNNPRWRPNSNRTPSVCHGIEEGFRLHLLEAVAETTAATIAGADCTGRGPESRTKRCKKIRDPYLEGLEKYRKLQRRFNGSLAQQWAQQDPSGQRARCLKSIGNGSDKKVALSNNSRVLAIQRSKSAQCQPIVTQWSLNQDQIAQDYLKGKKSLPGWSPEDINFLDSFNRAPLSRLLSARSKYDIRAQKLELKRDLNQAFSKTVTQLDSLKKRLEDSKGADSYKLYTFNNQFLEYAKGLPSPKNEEASQCIEKNGFKEDCFQTSGNAHGGRCAKRLLGFGKEFFPIFGLIDAFEGLRGGSTSGAEAAGVLSAEEAAAEKAGYAFQAFSGIPSAGVAAAVVKRIASAGIGATRRSVAVSRAANGAQAQVERVASAAQRPRARGGRSGRARRAANRRRNAGERIANLGARDRGDRARDFLGVRSLSKRKRDAVKEAHEIGSGEIGRDGKTPARFGNYTDGQLRKKLRRLREAGFTREQASNLVRAGIAGKPNKPFAEVFRQQRIVGDDQFISFGTADGGVRYGRILGRNSNGSLEVEYFSQSQQGFSRIAIKEEDIPAVKLDLGAKYNVRYPRANIQPGEPVIIRRSSGEYHPADIISIDGDDLVVAWKDPRYPDQVLTRPVSRAEIEQIYKEKGPPLSDSAGPGPGENFASASAGGRARAESSPSSSEADAPPPKEGGFGARVRDLWGNRGSGQAGAQQESGRAASRRAANERAARQRAAEEERVKKEAAERQRLNAERRQREREKAEREQQKEFVRRQRAAEEERVKKEAAERQRANAERRQREREKAEREQREQARARAQQERDEAARRAAANNVEWAQPSSSRGFNVQNDQFGRWIRTEKVNANSTQSAREILGIQGDYTSADVRRAVRALSQAYHPDKHTGANPEDLKVLSEITGKITQAATTLKKKLP